MANALWYSWKSLSGSVPGRSLAALVPVGSLAALVPVGSVGSLAALVPVGSLAALVPVGSVGSLDHVHCCVWMHGTDLNELEIGKLGRRRIGRMARCWWTGRTGGTGFPEGCVVQVGGYPGWTGCWVSLEPRTVNALGSALDSSL